MPKSKKIKIISSSSTSSDRKIKKSNKSKNNKREKKQISQKKRKPIIILSSSYTPERNETIKQSQMTTISDQILTSSFQNIDNDLKNSYINNIMPERLNEKFIDLMEKLSTIQTKQGEPFRARAYQKAQETIMSYQGNIISPNDLKGKPNIGPAIMEKLNEYIETGTLKVLEREKNNPINILSDVYGIGPKKANELVEKGITSIEQLRKNQQLLNDVQKVGLQYYEDVLKRIPRTEIDDYKQLFATPVSLEKVDLKVEIVGSYRRGAQNSGDIDIIITSKSEDTFKNIIDELIKQQIIIAVLSRGPSKCLVMAKIPSSDSVRRVDFLYTPPEEYPFAILYFTGSKHFNTMMRNKAQQMGLTMNEHGLYKISPDKKIKVDHIFKTEKDIFDYLNLEYKSPEERIDGRAIIPLPPLNPPLKKVEPNSVPNIQLLKKVEPNQPFLKVEPNQDPPLYVITQLEEPIQLAPKAPKITKAKTLKAKKKNTFDLVQPLLKVDKKIIIEEDSEEDLVQPFSKVDLALPLGKVELDALTEEELTELLNYANTMYRNFQPIMTDNEYDILEDYITEKYPDNQALHQIGAPPSKNKATLPYFMGSMDKIKPDTNALANWKAKYKGPYVLSCKLDGVSGLYTTEGKTPHLYTRGDGKVGQDISYLIPYLRLPKNKGLVVRGEFIIAKKTFETKYKTKFANARNMVSGIVNQKSVNPDVIQDVDFVAYEVIKPLVKPSEQFTTLQNPPFKNVEPNESSLTQFSVPLFKKVEKEELSNQLLSETLITWRQTSPYEIDGVIVTNDQVYPIRKDGNPEHSFAFKMVLSDQIAEAKVVDVIWTPSKDGYLKPRVQIEPIQLGGVKIEYATGFNGQFIQENKIGIGAIIELIRSGDVIPHIRKVVVPATQAKMPNIPYKWNDTHVDILLENIDTDEIVKEKVLTGFFRGIEVEGLSSGNIKRIIDAGYDSVPKILQMTTTDLLQVEGFKEKTAQKLYNNIQTQIQKAPLVTIMAASNIFGRGFNNKKLELILNEYPDVLKSNESQNIKTQKVANIKGMADKTAEAFISKIPAFLAFILEAHLEYKLQQTQNQQTQNNQKAVNQSHPLYNKTIVFTGFRDKQLEEQLKTHGAKLGSSVSKNTFIVLTKDPLEDTGKVLEAKKLGIPIMTPEEFKSIHL